MTDDQIQEKIEAGIALAMDGVEQRLAKRQTATATRAARAAVREMLGGSTAKLEPAVRKELAKIILEHCEKNQKWFDDQMKTALMAVIAERYVKALAITVNTCLNQYESTQAILEVRTAMLAEIKKQAEAFVADALKVDTKIRPLGRKLIASE